MWRDNLEKPMCKRTEATHLMSSIIFLSSKGMSLHVITAPTFWDFWVFCLSLQAFWSSQAISAVPSLNGRPLEFINIIYGVFTPLKFSRNADVSLSSSIMWSESYKLDFPLSFLSPSDF